MPLPRQGTQRRYAILPLPQLVSALTPQAPPPHQNEKADGVAVLISQREQQLAGLNSEAERIRQQLAALHEAYADADALRTEMEAAHTEMERLDAELSAAVQQAADAKAEREAAKAETEALRKEKAALNDSIEGGVAEVNVLREELAAIGSERDSVAESLQQVLDLKTHVDSYQSVKAKLQDEVCCIPCSTRPSRLC